MKLKSYFSATVEAAMDSARRELGDEALLVNARPATPETRYLGAYEVVFGVVDSPRDPILLPPSGEDLFRIELAEMRRQIDRLILSTGDQVYAISRVRRQQSPPGELYVSITEQLVCTRLGRPEAARSVVALVGPPGVGKTTTLIKLAARYGLARRKTTQILTADVNRIVAAEQLRALAAILGIPCEVADTPLVLTKQLDAHTLKELVLIDTPGFSFREMEDAAELAALLANRPDIDTHLVLSASMKPSDMRRVVQSYAIFRPSKLIFTRVDETDEYGALVSEAAHRNLPISFLSTGQRIPDDLEEASVSRLTDLVLGDARPLLRMGAFA